MDLEDQSGIKRIADNYPHEDIVVLLGTPNAESAGITAETVTTGDPTFAGPLGGVSLGLSVYHILEPEVRQEIDPDVYTTQVGVMELVLDAPAIIAEMKRYRPA